MLYVLDHGRCTIGIQVILLDGVVAPHSEQSGSRAIVANSGDAIDGRHALV